MIDYFLISEKDIFRVDIDLFLTGQSEAAIVCGGTFAAPVAGIILDAQTLELTLEFADGSTFHLNIPIEDAYKEKLLFAHRMYVGCFEGVLLADAFEAPLLYLNDPYGSAFGDKSPLSRTSRSVQAFEAFMRRCAFAQGLHRDNLGDEDGARSVLRGIDLNRLKHAPALVRQIQMAAIPKTQTAPQMPGPSGGSVQTATRTHSESKEDNDKSGKSGDSKSR